MKLKILLALWALGFYAHVNAQNRPKAANVATEASSPGSMASAYNKENQIPVNHYTGIPQVNIPLHSYNQGQLSHDLSLNYIGGGIRVNEPSGNVGLGWMLSGGGAITRSVQGLPDDMPWVGWLYTHNTRPSSDSISFQWLPEFGWVPVNNNINHLPQYYEDQRDGQFDIFQISAGALSAKFYFGKNQQIIVSPRQNITVTPTFSPSLGIQASTIESFTVTDDNGMRYIFNEREITTLTNTTPASNTNAHNNSGLYGRQHITAWYLKFIITPFNEDTIRFDYQQTTSTRSLPFPPSRYDQIGVNSHPTTHTPTGQSTINGWRLWRIHFPNQTRVNLVYDTQPRCDAPGENALTEIQVQDTAVRQRYLLNYTYGGQRGNIAYGGGCNNVGSDQRLMLRSVQPAGASMLLRPYEFDYDESRRLPPFLSPAQDHWGYFNGQMQNETLIPALSVNQGFYTGANRQPNALAAAAYSLRGIRFPSGGTTTFDYESNTYMAVAEIGQTANFQSQSFQQQVFSFNKINETATRFSIELTGSNESLEFFGHSQACNINLTIQGLHEGQWINGTTLSGGNQVLLSPHLAIMHPQIDLNFPPGTSQLRFIPTMQQGSNCTGANAFNYNVSWHTEAPDANLSNTVVGGLRVRRIAEYDGINVRPASVREFRYVQQGSNISSGYIAALPKYHRTLHFTHAGTRVNFLVRSGMPVNFQHFTQGSTVGYSRVEEIYGTAEQHLGSSIYEFTSYRDFTLPGHLFDFPYVPEQIPDWLLGLPKSITSIDGAGNLKEKTEYEYTPYQNQWAVTDSNLLAVKLGVSHEVQGSNGVVTNRQFITRFYRPVVGWVAMTRQVTTKYLESDTLRDWVEVTYDTAHFVPVRTRTVVNKQRNLIKENLTYYPFHYTINTGPIVHMRQHRWMVPISSETWMLEGTNRRLVDSEINQYDWVNGRIRLISKAGLIASEPIAQATIGNFNPGVLNRNTSLQPTLTTMTRFDALGNPIEVQNNITGQHETVIMGYGGRLPVAKIPNATFNEVAYSSFETTETGNWNYSGTTLVQTPRSVMGLRAYNLATGSIFRNGSGTPAGNYILSFWFRNGPPPAVTGATLVAEETNTFTGWNYREFSHTGGQNITISGNALIDELRLYPARTTIHTANFIPLLGEISACSADNMVSWKEYDPVGRPQRLLDKDWNIIQAVQYENATTQNVNRTPAWQDVSPLVLVCDNVPGTTFNNGQQLRQQTDTNPFSFSFNGLRFVPHGTNTTACPILPQWQPTGSTQCVVVNSVRTGEQLRQEQDRHPLSPSFGQTRWVSLGINGQCPPIQLRAWIQLRNQQFTYNSWGFQMTGDVFVVITDQDWNPVQVPSLTVNYQKTTNSNGWLSHQNFSVTINNASEAMIYSGLLTDFMEDSGFQSPWTFSYNFSTLPGTGYTPM